MGVPFVERGDGGRDVVVEDDGDEDLDFEGDVDGEDEGDVLDSSLPFNCFLCLLFKLAISFTC